MAPIKMTHKRSEQKLNVLIPTGIFRSRRIICKDTVHFLTERIHHQVDSGSRVEIITKEDKKEDYP